MTFTADISKFVAKTKKNANKVVQGVALDLFSKAVIRTPVGNSDLWNVKYKPKNYAGGRLRNNWNTMIGRIDRSTTDKVDPSGAQAIRKMTAEVNIMNLGDAVFMTNNLPYALRVEDGWSSQAPAGMVKATVSEFRRAVRKQAKKHKGRP